MIFKNIWNPLLILFTLYLNFISLTANPFDVANPRSLERADNLGSTTLIIGRLVKSRLDGIFSANGFPGRFKLPAESRSLGINDKEYQYTLFHNKTALPESEFASYTSQIGGQGFFFGFLEVLLVNTLSSQQRLALYKNISAFLLSGMLTAILFYIFQKFGAISALFCQVSVLFSPQLIIFGPNIWWQPWVFFLPMVLLLYGRNILLLSFLGIFVKCFFTGYEYITTAYFLLLTPLILRNILERKRHIESFYDILKLTLGFIAAICCSLVILFSQHASMSGSMKSGINHIIFSFEKRTTGTNVITSDAHIQKSFEAKHLDVLNYYLKRAAFRLKQPSRIETGQHKITFGHLLIALIVVSFLSIFIFKIRPERDNKSFALCCGAWCSFIGAISWLLIFKAHSFIHEFQNPLVFYLPFTLMLSAYLGYQISLVIQYLLYNRKPSS